ncbi:MAG: efflux RND transporter periplasmic adaptor subunit [Thermoanaerobaculales bacterium]|nr:efflux RND transporter periplasmic adaptor subunit [Thermoanaerobaculales bacterium]
MNQSGPSHNLSDLAIDDDARDADNGRRWVRWVTAAALVVILIATVLAVRGCSPALEVRVATARAADSGASATVLNASGYVEPRRKAMVAAKITGRVSEVLVDEGMVVEAGQVLARLDDADARRRADAARASRDVAHASIEEIRVNLADAERRLRRTRELFTDGVASEQDMDASTAAVDALAAQLVVGRRSLDAAEAQLAVARQDLENHTIRAPFAGVAVSKEAQPGEMVAPVFAGGGGISTIVDMTSLEIEVDVNESYIARVVPGQPAEAILDAYPGWRIPATVRTVIPTADRQKATVKVRLTFDRLDPRILPDMGVKVAFQESAGDVDDAPRAVSVVPRAAVRSSEDRQIVFLVSGDVVERRAVTIGRELGAESEVLAGVAVGNVVVIEPPEGLADGQRVTVIEDPN